LALAPGRFGQSISKIFMLLYKFAHSLMRIPLTALTMGSKAKSDGVRIFVAEKWVDSVVSVERHSERILVLKMVLGDCLLNVFTVYAPHSGKPDEE